MLLLALVCITGQSLAQRPQSNRPMPSPEERKNQLVERLGLEGEKSIERFSEIYAEYNTRMREIRNEFKAVRPEKGEKQTDEQIEKNILNRFAMSRAILDVREQFYPRFREVLSPRQVQQLYNFEQQQGERMQQRHRQGHPMGRAAGNGAQRGGARQGR